MNHHEPCGVIELRRYTLHPGRREALIALFEREFVETQEALGLRVLGQFRDLDDADAFVWLRGFADMSARRSGLAAFYGRPVWARHRDAANATMIEPVLVGVAAFADAAAEQHRPWVSAVASALTPRGLAGAAVLHRLVPTARSALHGAMT
jgi:hypothetical protein